MKLDLTNYDPEQFAPIKSGNYPFTVVGATEGKSQQGNPMISLELHVMIPGREKPLKIYDYLVMTTKSIFIVDQFCKTTGLTDQFKSAELQADMIIGKTGWAHIVPDKKNPGTDYMEVGWYTTNTKNLSQSSVKPLKTKATDTVIDDIPF